MEFEHTLTATTDASDELPAGDEGLDGQAGVWKQARREVCLNIDVRALWEARRP